MSKVKQFFENLSYKEKYNTLKIKYEALLEKVTGDTLSPFEDLESLKKDIKYLKGKYTNLKARISDLEAKGKK